jgi:arginyl-tRNA synthetase
MKETIEVALQTALTGLSLVPKGVVLDIPAEEGKGDFASSVALACAKDAGMAPKVLAEKIVEAMGSIDGVEKIEVAGPGFINFYLAAASYVPTISAAQSEAFGTNDVSAGKKIMSEFTDPNPFKSFHIGHLMSNTIGESISRLFENGNARVTRVNYQGDVGMHVASAIWGIKKLSIDIGDAKEFGRAYAHGATAYKEDEVAKTEIAAINKALYDRSDTELNALYDAGRRASLDLFEDIYATLGTRFIHYFYESETAPIGKELVLAHPELFVESEGARVFKGEEYGLHTRVFLNSQGLPTYEAKELGLEKLKMDLYPDTEMLVIVTANEINEYFKVLKKAMELVYPEIAARVQHVSHGFMRLPEGKMSSRTGNIVTGESLIDGLIDAATERAKESRAEDAATLAKQIAVAAIKFQILKGAIGKDMVFDEAKALSLEGDSGPYVQYSYARAMSVLRAGAEAGIEPAVEAPETEGEKGIARLVMRYPDVALRAQAEIAPHHVAQYVGTLASAYNSWYAHEHVLGTPDAPRRLALTQAVATTIKNALNLLGIEAPEKM